MVVYKGVYLHHMQTNAFLYHHMVISSVSVKVINYRGHYVTLQVIYVKACTIMTQGHSMQNRIFGDYLTAIFPCEPGSTSSPLGLSPPLKEENLLGVERISFFGVGFPFHQTSVLEPSRKYSI